MSNKVGHNFYKPQKRPSFYPHIQCYKRPISHYQYSRTCEILHVKNERLPLFS